MNTHPKNDGPTSYGYLRIPTVAASTVLEVDKAASMLVMEEPEAAMCEWLMERGRTHFTKLLKSLLRT